MANKVLMTGASGFVGSNSLEYLLNKTDWDFTCLSSWRHKGNPLRVPKNPRVTVITHDLTGVMPDLGHFDYILNLASESHVDRSIADPVPFIENNVSSTLQMLEYARRYPPKIFVQFSTDEVFGATNHLENDVLLPSNPYAASKACQEMVALAYWKTYKIPIVITNCNNIVGKGQDREKFVPKIAELIKSGQEVTIHTANGKPGQRFYNPVDNVAAALLFILSSHEPNFEKHARFNLPGGKRLDNLEMAKLVAKIMGKKLSYKLVDAESVRPGYDQFYPEAGGALLELGFEPPLTLEQGLQWLKD